jgi:hypothetical protein
MPTSGPLYSLLTRGHDSPIRSSSHETMDYAFRQPPNAQRMARFVSWYTAVPAIFSAIALFFVPGYPIVRILGAKGFASAALSPVVSCALVGLAGLVSGFAPLRWNVWLLAGVTLLCTLAVLLGSGRVHRLPREPKKTTNPPALKSMVWILAVGAPATFITWVVASSMGRPDSFGQKYDNVFHLNAIEFILSTGDASSLTLGRMTSPNSFLAIYPSVWHSLSALIMQLTNVNVLVAQNALTLVACSVIWPVSMICLARALFGFRPVVIVTAGLLCASFWVFPYQFLAWGPLLPNLLSYALLPVALIVVIDLFGRLDKPLFSTGAQVSFLVLITAAFFFTQPNGFTSTLVLAIPIFVPKWLRFVKKLMMSTNSRIQRTGILARWVAVPIIAFAGIWAALILKFDQWLPTRTPVQAIGDVVTGGLMGGHVTAATMVVATCGILAAIHSKIHRWLVVALSVSMGLYWIAAVVPKGVFRHAVIGSWYQDTYRLAALVPIFVILLACLGMDFLTRLSLKSLAHINRNQFAGRFGAAQPDQRSISAAGVPAVALAVVFSGALVSCNYNGLTTVAKDIATSYSYSEGRIISLDEYTLMQRLPTAVPADAVIAVNPFNGGTLAYAIASRRVTEINLAPGPDADLLTIGQDLATAKAGSKTCQLAAEMNIQYILDFGASYMTAKSQATDNYPGLVDVVPSMSTRLIDSQGAAKLYEVTACTTEP